VIDVQACTLWTADLKRASSRSASAWPAATRSASASTLRLRCDCYDALVNQVTLCRYVRSDLRNDGLWVAELAPGATASAEQAIVLTPGSCALQVSAGGAGANSALARHYTALHGSLTMLAERIEALVGLLAHLEAGAVPRNHQARALPVSCARL
jgi:hypothetical protein